MHRSRRGGHKVLARALSADAQDLGDGTARRYRSGMPRRHSDLFVDLIARGLPQI